MAQVLSARPTPSISTHSTHSDSDDDEVSDLPPAPPPNFNRVRRTSVSAESITPTAAGVAYAKVVVPKTEEQRGRIEQAVKNNFLFRGLDEEQHGDVVNAMVERKVESGEDIIVQGAVGDYFYVVESGTFDFIISRNGSAPTKVGSCTSGASFGELALMYNAPRAATVRATSDSVVWGLDRVTFRRILMETANKKRKMYEAFLEEVPLLVSLEPYERHKIADALESVSFEDGEEVIRQGDVGESFYIVESGEARVVKVDESGVEHEFPSLTKGSYFGELALLTNKPRAASIIAKGKLQCATMGKRPFTRLLGPVVDILKRNVSNYEVLSEKHKITFDDIQS